MADEDPVDPMTTLRERCEATTCSNHLQAYQDCATRYAEAEASGKLQETKFADHDCEAYLFKLRHCSDGCAAPQLFKQLK